MSTQLRNILSNILSLWAFIIAPATGKITVPDNPSLPAWYQYRDALTKLRTREGGAGSEKVKEKVNMATPRWCCHMSVIKCLTSF